MANPTVVELPESLTIATAESLHEQLGAFTAEAGGVVLNAAAVVRADTAGLQLIYAFMQNLHKNEVTCSWCDVPDILSDAAAQLGLRELLSL